MDKHIFIFVQEVDHVGYVSQAFEAASLSHFAEILRSDILKDSDVSLHWVVACSKTSELACSYCWSCADFVPDIYSFLIAFE